MTTKPLPRPQQNRGWQCPQCLDRDMRNMSCDCDPEPRVRHDVAPMNPLDTCEAACTICGWGGTYPELPGNCPEPMIERAQLWMDLGFLPAECVWLAWAQMVPTDPLAVMAGSRACNSAGSFQIDAVCLMVQADRLPVGTSPLEALEGMLRRLDLLEERSA